MNRQADNANSQSQAQELPKVVAGETPPIDAVTAPIPEAVQLPPERTEPEPEPSVIEIIDSTENEDTGRPSVSDRMRAEYHFPRLRVTLWNEGCVWCEVFKREALPKLQATGWTVGGPESHIELVEIPPESPGAVPHFEWVTSDGVAATLDRYPGVDGLFAWLRQYGGVQ